MQLPLREIALAVRAGNPLLGGERDWIPGLESPLRGLYPDDHLLPLCQCLVSHDALQHVARQILVHGQRAEFFINIGGVN